MIIDICENCNEFKPLEEIYLFTGKIMYVCDDCYIEIHQDISLEDSRRFLE